MTYLAKLNCLHVAPRYEILAGISVPPGATVLEDGCTQIAAAGFTGIGLFLSPNYAGGFNPRADYVGEVWGATPTNLTQLLQTTPYQNALSTPGIDRFFFKFWTFYSGIGDPERVSTTPASLAAEYTEIYNAALYLLQNTSGKDFYFQTSESDWAYIGDTDTDADIPYGRAQQFIAFFGCHVAAIRDARAAAGVSTSRVFSAFEVNRALDGGHSRIHRDVLPFISPDAISMSIYEAINDFVFLNQADSLVSIDTKIRKVVGSIRKEYAKTHGAKAAADMPLFFGEYGWPETNPNMSGHDPAAFVDQLLTTADAIGVGQANFWQWWCNDLGPAAGAPVGVLSDQCVYRSSPPTPSVQGARLLALV